jgi:outer membrane protein OmpA-like peptidoglycan-associated protein
MRARPWRSSLLLGLVVALGVLVGCMTREVKSASEALEQARAAGKDRECPPEFQEAEALVKQAEQLCQSCKRDEANALANQAMGKISALCPAKPTPPPAPAPEPVRTPPPPPAAGPPTASLTANPGSLNAGACAELTWSATNSSSVMIDPEVGSVGPSGTRRVCPSSTTRYTLTVNGPGGTRSADTTVTVKPKPTETLTIHVNFDTNKSVIKKSDQAELDKLEAFVRKYSSCKFEVNGYTDSTGPDAFNQTLSEKRADAVKTYIISKGGNADRVTAAGHGESNPVGDNKTAKGRAENRRAEVEAYCQ